MTTKIPREMAKMEIRVTCWNWFAGSFVQPMCAPRAPRLATSQFLAWAQADLRMNNVVRFGQRSITAHTGHVECYQPS